MKILRSQISINLKRFRGAAENCSQKLMDSITPISVVILPGLVALLMFLLFTYLYEQSRHQYFRAWQLGWAAYTLHYALDAWVASRMTSSVISFLSSLLLMAMALCIFVSTRLMGRQKFVCDGMTWRSEPRRHCIGWWNLKLQSVEVYFVRRRRFQSASALGRWLRRGASVLLFLFLPLRAS